MTTATNHSIDNKTRQLAANKSQETGEDTVICKATVSNKRQAILVASSVFAAAPENTDIEFIAIVNANGDYVD